MKDVKQKSNGDKSPISQWLEHLQQNSWELELIISGLAIYGLVQFSVYINEAGRYHTAIISDNIVSDIKLVILILGDVGTRIFIFNLIIHLFVRGLWIGAVGLRYVSGDYDFDELNFNDKFISYYKRKIGSFDLFIQKLENLASVIFSFTFLLFFIVVSALLLIAMLFLYEFLIDHVLKDAIGIDLKSILFPVEIIFMVLFGMVFIDFIFLGVFKRIEQRHFSYVYFHLYRTVGWLTLSVIWRPLFLNFLDNPYTRKLLWIIVPYFILGLLSLSEYNNIRFNLYPVQDIREIKSGSNVFAKEVAKLSILPMNYDNLRMTNEKADRVLINSISLKNYLVSDTYLEVFVSYNDDFERALVQSDSTLLSNRTGKLNGLLSYNNPKLSILDVISGMQDKNELKPEEIYRRNIEKVYAACMNEISFTVDDNLLSKDTYHCEFYQHSNAGERGFLCFLPVDSINLGRHLLEYQKISLVDDVYDTLSYYVPFFKQ